MENTTDHTTYLWRPPAGHDQGIGQILSLAFRELFGGAVIDDQTARVWWARLQEEMEADAEMQGRKIVVYRATPEMVQQASQTCSVELTPDMLGKLLTHIQTMLDRRAG